MLRAESSIIHAPVLQGSAQGLVLRNQHAVCSEAVLRSAAGCCSQHQAVKLPCCREVLMHMLHSTTMLTLSSCQLLQ